MGWIAVDISTIMIETILYLYLFFHCAPLQKNRKIQGIILIITYMLLNYALELTRINDSIKIIFIIILGCIMSKRLFEISWKTMASLNLIYYLSSVFSDSLVMGFIMCLNPDINIGIFQQNNLLRFEFIAGSKVIFFILIVLLVRMRGIKEYRYSKLEMTIFLLQGAVILFSLFIVVEFTYYRLVEYKITPIIFLLWTLGLIVAYIGSYVLFERYIQGKHKEKELLEVQSYMETQFAHYKHMMERREELQKIWHDIKNVLAAYQIAGEQHEEELQHYLQDVMKGPEELIIETGTPVANAILYDKGKVAKEKRITFEAGVEPEAFSFMENVDICILLSNLLDNAIEACEKCEGNRWICIEAKRKGEYLILNVDNSKANKIRKKNGVMITSKKEKNQHGYGWKNIESVIKKYEGTKNISDSSHEFHVTIMLNTSFTK